jgi:purine-binding chemotaxis protein CheW
MSQAINNPRATDRHAGGSRTYTTFRLRDGLFGIATEMVKEIAALTPLTPVPHAPAAIRGYVNLRGHIVVVVDLDCLLQREAVPKTGQAPSIHAPEPVPFSREPADLSPETRLIVFKPDLGDAFGVLAERIGDIVELSDDQIETHRTGIGASGADLGDSPEEALIRGVGMLDGALMSIVEARALVPCLERAVARRGSAADRPRFETEKENSL